MTIIDKTTLENRLRDKSEARYYNEKTKALNFIKENQILNSLNIKIYFKKEDDKIVTNEVSLAELIEDIHHYEEETNYKELKKQVMKNFENEEFDNILNKLSTLDYIFNQQ